MPTNYVNDDLDLADFPKVDIKPSAAAAINKFDAADANNVRTAVNDIKDAIRGGKFFGLARQSADPAPSGIEDYLWLALDGKLTLVRPSGSTVIVDAEVSLGRAGGLLGDSNVEGKGSTDHLDRSFGYATGFAPVQYLDNHDDATENPPVWITFGPGNLGPYTTGSTAGVGVELALGHDLFAAMGAAPMVKRAMGGSSAADWHPTATSPATAGVNMLAQFMADLASLVTSSGERIGWVYLGLGSNDASSSPLASAYLANMQAIIAHIRATYPGVWVAVPKLHTSCTETFTSDVITAQTSLFAADDHILPIEVSDLPTSTPGSTPPYDGLHYSADGYTTIGQRAAAGIAKSLGHAQIITTAYPQFVGSGVGVCGSGAQTPSPWAGGIDGDLEVLVVPNGLIDTPPVLSTAAGFTLISAALRSIYFGSNYEQFAAYQRTVDHTLFVNGQMPSPTVQDTNDLNSAVIYTFRSPTGSCVIDGTPVGTAGTYGTGATTLTGVTTLGANRLIAMIAGGYTPTGTNTVVVTHAGLTSVAEQRDALYVIGSDCQMISLTTGVKATAGATGDATLTPATNGTFCGLVIALKAA